MKIKIQKDGFSFKFSTLAALARLLRDLYPDYYYDKKDVQSI